MYVHDQVLTIEDKQNICLSSSRQPCFIHGFVVLLRDPSCFLDVVGRYRPNLLYCVSAYPSKHSCFVPMPYPPFPVWSLKCTATTAASPAHPASAGAAASFASPASAATGRADYCRSGALYFSARAMILTDNRLLPYYQLCPKLVCVCFIPFMEGLGCVEGECTVDCIFSHFVT